MTREECIALLERYGNYEGMGIPNLVGCKEAMLMAAKLLKPQIPSDDLEEATARYGSGYCDIGLRRTAEFGFRSGAEWQRQQMMTDEEMKCALRMEYEKGVFDTTAKYEQLPSDVEGAAEKYRSDLHKMGDDIDEEGCMYRNVPRDAFQAGAEWAFSQGEIVEGSLGYGPHLQRPIIMLEGVPSFYDGHCQDVIVQIRKKEE